MKLSIVIPAYNAGSRLDRVVKSLLNQTLTDLEVIIANDGSQDNTSEVAHRLAASDSRVQAFDLFPNAGAYGARLFAWKKARGEFITAVDADDWVEPDMYAMMVALAERENLDVVQCETFDSATADGSVEILTEDDVFRRLVYPTFIDCGAGAYVWNKIYRNQYDFSSWIDGSFGGYEDLIHNLQLFKPVKRMAFLRRGYYHYEVTSTSITRTFNMKGFDRFENAIKAKRELVGTYGVRPNDEVVDRWIVNDARNAFLMTAMMGTVSIQDRIKATQRLFMMPALREAMSRVPHCSRGWRLLAVAERFPGPVIRMVRLVKMMKG